MTIKWFCKYGQVSGEIILPDHAIDNAINTDELSAMVKADHAKRCNVGGEPWVLFDGSIPGTISHDTTGVEIRLHLPEGPPRTAAEYSPVYPLMVLHVQ